MQDMAPLPEPQKNNDPGHVLSEGCTVVSQIDTRIAITEQEEREWMNAGRQLTRSERSIAMAYFQQVFKSRPKVVKPALSLVVLNGGRSG